MKVAILSRKPSLFATERLRTAGLARGHEVQTIDYLRCYMNISAVRPTILYRGETLPEFDAVIPRIGASHTVYGTAVVRQFEILGVTTANGSDAISRAHDKLRSLQILAAQGIGLPSTGFAHSSRDLAGLLAGVGDAPVVVKLLNGMPGTGAILAETNAAAASVIEAFSGLDAESLVQEFIAESAGTSCAAWWWANAWWRQCVEALGPASSARTCIVVATPCECGYRATNAGPPSALRPRWDWTWRASTCSFRIAARW